MAGREQRDLESFKTLESGNSVRYRLDIDRGQVTVYAVHLETYVDGRWRPVARFDSAHGHPHRDLLGWDGRVIDKLWLDPTLDPKAAVRQAERDFKENASAFVAAFLERKP